MQSEIVTFDYFTIIAQSDRLVICKQESVVFSYSSRKSSYLFNFLKEMLDLFYYSCSNKLIKLVYGSFYGYFQQH